MNQILFIPHQLKVFFHVEIDANRKGSIKSKTFWWIKPIKDAENVLELLRFWRLETI